MSDIPTDYQERLNLREQIARIDRALEESHKFAAEQRRLIAEDRDRFLAPWLLFVSLFAALSGGVVVAIISHFWK